MNALNKIVFTAGQKAHENLLGATLTFPTLPDVITIPCTSSKPRKGWILANGKSPETFVESIKFFVANIPEASFDYIEKGLEVTLLQSPDNEPIDLRLDDGGLTTDGLAFDFKAMDRNQRA